LAIELLGLTASNRPLSRRPDFSYFRLLETKRTTACLGHMAYWVSKAEEFRARAAECEEKANQAKDAEAKRLLREAAETWRSMATQVERLGG
jgi:hypothetical protein